MTMWTLFNRRKGSELDTSAPAGQAAGADMNHLPSKIPVEARPIDDPGLKVAPLLLSSLSMPSAL